MIMINILVPFIVFGVLNLVLFVSRKRGMGKLGQRIRNSDHWALEDAINEKKQELDELIKLRPKYLKE